MTYKLHTNIVCIDRKPTPLLNTHDITEITVGDLHSHAIKFLYILVLHGFLNPTDDVYNELVELYKKTPTSKEALRRFSVLLNNIPVTNRTINLRLLGDDLADRGKNDYFILKIYKKILQENIPITTIFSNHTAAFLEAYTPTQLAKQANSIDSIYTPSLYHLSTCIDEDMVEFNEVQSILEHHYKRTLKLLDYSLDKTNQSITLFSHAAIGFETLPLLAQQFNIPYTDKTPRDLARTIDKINAAFKMHVKNNTLQSLYSNEQFDEIKKGFPTAENAVLFTLWNKTYSQLIRPEIHHGYAMHFVHGHHPHDPEQSAHITNLDNQLGKCAMNHQGQYTALISNETKLQNTSMIMPAHFSLTLFGLGFLFFKQQSYLMFSQGFGFFSRPLEKLMPEPISKFFRSFS